jgi:hypothetical protein
VEPGAPRGSAKEAVVNLKLLLAACAATLVAVTSAPAFADTGLLGSTVDVTARFPDQSTIFFDPGAVLVTAGVEYPSGSYPPYNPSWEVDVGDHQIVISDALGTGLPFQPGTFNGFVLHVLSGLTIATSSIDAASTLVPVDTFVSGGDLFINFVNVDQPKFGAAIVDFTTAGGKGGTVPEPATWALLITGFGAVGASLRLRRRRMATA